MIHRLTIGHLDPDAVRERRVVVTRPLDMGIVTRLLGEFGEPDAAGRPNISGRPVEIHDGYLVCPWLMPSPIPGVAEFALKLQEQTGCLMADVHHATVVDRELLLSQSYPQRVPRGESEGQAARGLRGR
jgi:hypothetical protein